MQWLIKTKENERSEGRRTIFERDLVCALANRSHGPSHTFSACAFYRIIQIERNGHNLQGLYSLHSRCTHQIAATFDCLLFTFGTLVDSFLHPQNVCRCPLHYFLLLLVFIVAAVGIAAGDGRSVGARDPEPCLLCSAPDRFRRNGRRKKSVRLEKGTQQWNPFKVDQTLLTIYENQPDGAANRLERT